MPGASPRGEPAIHQKGARSKHQFFDTANRYSLGNSEEILGRAIKGFERRDEVVIATKVDGRMRPGHKWRRAVA
jgi:aryl-alcohol dehydrogenase-like predicted oxidoreductase